MFDDPNVVIFCIPPHMKVQRYIKIKAYENHFCVNDASNTTIVIYDSGMASIMVTLTNDFLDNHNMLESLRIFVKLDDDVRSTYVTLLALPIGKSFRHLCWIRG
jgi:hypothetical protein